MNQMKEERCLIKPLVGGAMFSRSEGILGRLRGACNLSSNVRYSFKTTVSDVFVYIDREFLKVNKKTKMQHKFRNISSKRTMDGTFERKNRVAKIKRKGKKKKQSQCENKKNQQRMTTTNSNDSNIIVFHRSRGQDKCKDKCQAKGDLNERFQGETK